MSAISFADARRLVLERVSERRAASATERVSLLDSAGRVLAEGVRTDRNYPPFHRSARDGFAVRAVDIPGRLRVVGEVRAGQRYTGHVGQSEAVEIMTGAPVPEGADAVVMVEYCERDADWMRTERTEAAGANIVRAACEANSGQEVLPAGLRVDHTMVAWLATTGHSEVAVYRKPRVAIIATGDEIVPVDTRPAPQQIRNSNAYSLAAQVKRAGGEPVLLPVAKDEREATAALVKQGLESDLLLLSGGVSAGKYDFVEAALADNGAEFFFDRVLIQPGQPLVFGHAGTFFFGLPGNPASTMVTFELFARAAIDLLSGMAESKLLMSWARLTTPFRHRTGLTRFLPAVVECGELTPVAWNGSGDVPSLCRANAFLVADPERAEYAEGDWIRMIAK